MMIRLWLAALLLTMASAHAEPIAASDIYVIDVDTIEAGGQRIRLVGFDPPELGNRAHCERERMLATRATSQLRQIIRVGEKIDLQLVPCSSRNGTEGTRLCNYGRSCGYLKVDGQDVGDTLIAENLANPLLCGRFGCPKRQAWCPFEPIEGYRESR